MNKTMLVDLIVHVVAIICAAERVVAEVRDEQNETGACRVGEASMAEFIGLLIMNNELNSLYISETASEMPTGTLLFGFILLIQPRSYS